MTEPTTELPRRPERRPVAEAARTRLRDAQRREAEALHEVTKAEKVRDRARRVLEKAEQALVVAQTGLVTVSGADRAALLLGEPVAVLRSRIRHTGPATRATPQAAPSRPDAS